MTSATRLATSILALLIVVSLSAGSTNAQDSSGDTPRKEDEWMYNSDEQPGIVVATKELTLYPCAEPKPALKYRFLPDNFSAVQGNAAIFYLKASGFLEQNLARDKLSEYWRDARAKAAQEGKEFIQEPPYVWLDTPPDALPLKEVKEYLVWTSFQPPILREGAQRDRFDMDRHFRDVEDPVAYLLPEIQGLPEIARTQSLRCRVAIAEDRIDDAMEIIGQQFAMARHLGQDDFLVSNLFGLAIAGIAWNDLLYVVQHPKAPNLYWALAAMPSPLVDMRQRAMDVERQFLYQQLKVLKEVDETPRPPGYWQEFIDRLIKQTGHLAGELNLPAGTDDPESARAAMVGFVAAAYPGAKDYLLNEQKLPPDQVEAYPTAQVVFLAVVRFYDQWRDEVFKWTFLPYWQARSKETASDEEQALRAAGNRYGWCSAPTVMLLPAVSAARTAEASGDQRIALAQTVEAVRMYAATHNGQLPPSLDVLSVPAPIEPFTGQPIEYERKGDLAVVNGHVRPGMRYRLILRIAK